MGANVSRRGFLRIATDSIVTIPAAVAASTAAMAANPGLALADETESTSTSTLYTNDVQLIPLTISEVGFVV